MPIFDYKCEKCDHVFEKIVSFSDADKKQECPKCGHNKTKKQFTNSVGLHFKGNWFANNKTY